MHQIQSTIEIPELTIAASNASNVDVDVDGVNVDGSEVSMWSNLINQHGD